MRDPNTMNDVIQEPVTKGRPRIKSADKIQRGVGGADEARRRAVRKEQNRRAARKYRHKQQRRANNTVQEFYTEDNLHKTLQNDIEALLAEKAYLEDVLRNHALVCTLPHEPTTSQSVFMVTDQTDHHEICYTQNTASVKTKFVDNVGCVGKTLNGNDVILSNGIADMRVGGNSRNSRKMVDNEYTYFKKYDHVTNGNPLLVLNGITNTGTTWSNQSAANNHEIQIPDPRHKHIWSSTDVIEPDYSSDVTISGVNTNRDYFKTPYQNLLLNDTNVVTSDVDWTSGYPRNPDKHHNNAYIYTNEITNNNMQALNIEGQGQDKNRGNGQGYNRSKSFENVKTSNYCSKWEQREQIIHQNSQLECSQPSLVSVNSVYGHTLGHSDIGQVVKQGQDTFGQYAAYSQSGNTYDVIDDQGIPTSAINMSGIPSDVVDITDLSVSVVDGNGIPRTSHIPSDVIDVTGIPYDLTTSRSSTAIENTNNTDTSDILTDIPVTQGIPNDVTSIRGNSTDVTRGNPSDVNWISPDVAKIAGDLFSDIPKCYWNGMTY